MDSLNLQRSYVMWCILLVIENCDTTTRTTLHLTNPLPLGRRPPGKDRYSKRLFGGGPEGWLILRFLSYFVTVTKCIPDACDIQNPKGTAVNEILRLKGTPCDTYTRNPESRYQLVLDMGGGLKFEQTSQNINDPTDVDEISFMSPCLQMN